MSRFIPIAIIGLVLLFACPTARAGLIYRFDQSTYTVSPGGTVDVRVFLEESGSSVLTTDGALINAPGAFDSTAYPPDSLAPLGLKAPLILARIELELRGGTALQL